MLVNTGRHKRENSRDGTLKNKMEQSQLNLTNGARKTSLLTGRKLEQDQPRMVKEETSPQNRAVFSLYKFPAHSVFSLN